MVIKSRSALDPQIASKRIEDCPFAEKSAIEALLFRDYPFFYTLLTSRHIGIHKPDDRICNWTARLLTEDKRYIQKCLGPALDLGRGRVSFEEAIERAFTWFSQPSIKSISNEAKETGRVSTISICPTGEVYTVGHALKDYTEWTQMARSPGGHYNNLVLINHHLVPHFSAVALEEFSGKHLSALAKQVLETRPRFGFMAYQPNVSMHDLSADELRKRKRTFNSLVTIMRMAFRHAWDNAEINTERPWQCLKRISVNHSPRTTFLTRDECLLLLEYCTPALRRLVLAALYTGCRVGELGNLRVEDVGHQIYGIRVAAFKRSPARFVFLPDEGMAFFLSCCDGKSGRDYVFRSDMNKVWRRQHSGLFRRAVAKAKLPKSFVFHGLRHTYASELVRAGVQLQVVAKQLGHANTMTVSNTYGHLAEQFREDQIRTRFTPLCVEQSQAALARRSQLDQIWQSTKAGSWRDYAKIEAASLRPSKSYLRTDKRVIELFDGSSNLAYEPTNYQR